MLTIIMKPGMGLPLKMFKCTRSVPGVHQSTKELISLHNPTTSTQPATTDRDILEVQSRGPLRSECGTGIVQLPQAPPPPAAAAAASLSAVSIPESAKVIKALDIVNSPCPIEAASSPSGPSSLKLANIARSIVNKKADNAVNQLKFSNKRIANNVLKVLNAAIANAENNKQLDIDNLYIKEAFVGKSLSMKRFRPRAKGRASSIVKPFSKLTIILEERVKIQKGKDK